MNEQEILNKLFEIEVRESSRIFEKSSKSNQVVFSLKVIYEDFLKVEKEFHFYIDSLYTLFEAEDVTNQKTLSLRVRKVISNLSRNIGKLDKSLDRNPPLIFKDVEAANSYISRIKDAYQRISEEIEEYQSDEAIELNELYELLKTAYFSLKVRIAEFNSRSKAQKLIEL